MAEAVYRRFAENLMALCMKHGSIAEVCRQTGINRQQFNKYLAGAGLPSAETLAKLAQFFQISELALFVGEAPATELPPAPRHSAPDFLPWGNPADNLPFEPGLFAIFGPWMRTPGMLFRGTIFVQPDSQRFSRYLYFSKLPEIGGVRWHNRIDGRVLQAGPMMFALAYEQHSPASMLTSFAFNTENHLNGGMWPGLVLAFLPTGLPVASHSLLVREPPGTTLRQSLRMNGIHQAASPLIPPAVAAHLEGLRNSPAGDMLYCADALQNWREPNGK